VCFEGEVAGSHGCQSIATPILATPLIPPNHPPTPPTHPPSHPRHFSDGAFAQALASIPFVYTWDDHVSAGVGGAVGGGAVVGWVLAHPCPQTDRGFIRSQTDSRVHSDHSTTPAPHTPQPPTPQDIFDGWGSVSGWLLRGGLGLCGVLDQEPTLAFSLSCLTCLNRLKASCATPSQHTHTPTHPTHTMTLTHPPPTQ